MLFVDQQIKPTSVGARLNLAMHDGHAKQRPNMSSLRSDSHALYPEELTQVAHHEAAHATVVLAVGGFVNFIRIGNHEHEGMQLAETSPSESSSTKVGSLGNDLPSATRVRM